MPERPDTTDYRALFLSPTPMMDVRAPAEFRRGAFASALSLPLLSDDERTQVGICYKQRGQDAAITLGHQLVSGDLKALRLAQWKAFTEQHPQGYLYCFRGGLRSQTVRQWLREEGINYPLVTGGYKAMRQFLLEELQRTTASARFVLISGRTGTGKTRVITRLARGVDLEGLANHRGSSFGQMITAQPSQIDFENGITTSLMRLLAAGAEHIFLEDEGRLIGGLSLPGLLREKMAAAPIVVVEEPLESRIDVVIEDYVLDLGRRFSELFGEDGPRLHAKRLQDDLLRIRKRLGGQQQQNASALMAVAFEQQREHADLSAHRQWIALLLEKYYDPMYEYQLSKRGGKRLFSGDRQAVIAWAQQGA